MALDIAFNPPRFDSPEYDAMQMRALVEELERLHASLTADVDDEGEVGFVLSFNNRTGEVEPEQQDYAAFYEGVLGNPAADGYVLSSLTDGTRSWVDPDTFGVGGSGVDNQIAIWSAADSIEGSADLTFDGTKLTLGEDTPINWGSNELLDFTAGAGVSSILFTGVGGASGQVVSVPDDAIWDVGSSDYTWEADVRLNSLTGNDKTVLDKRVGGAQSGWVIFFDVSAGDFVVAAWGSGISTPRILLSTTSTISVNTWYTIAVTKSGTTWNLYLNGTREATGTENALVTGNASPLRIGLSTNSFDNYRPMNGWIDNIRITPGVARYTGTSYTLPTGPYPTSSAGDADFASVALLTDCNGDDGATTLTDQSDDARTFTFANGAQLDASQDRFGGGGGGTAVFTVGDPTVETAIDGLSIDLNGPTQVNDDLTVTGVVDFFQSMEINGTIQSFQNGARANAALKIDATEAAAYLNATGAPLDAKKWSFRAYDNGTTGLLEFATAFDSDAAGTPWLEVTRLADQVSNITFTSNGPVTFNAGTVSFPNSTLQAASFRSENTTAGYTLYETDAAVDNRRWEVAAGSERFWLGTAEDVGTFGQYILRAERTGTVVDEVAILNDIYSFTPTEFSAPVIRATSTGDLSPVSTGHGFQVGLTSGNNIGMDGNEIMARNNGVVSTLFMQVDGGAVNIGNVTPADLNVTGQTTLTKSGTRADSALDIGASQASIYLRSTTAGADEKNWDILAYDNSGDGRFRIATATDANGFGVNLLEATRTGDQVQDVTINANGVLTLNANSVSMPNSTVIGSNFRSESTTAGFTLFETDATVNNKRWEYAAGSEVMWLGTAQDVGTFGQYVLRADRTGTVVDQVDLLNNKFQFTPAALTYYSGLTDASIIFGRQASESMQMYLDDLNTIFTYTQDETTGDHSWVHNFVSPTSGVKSYQWQESGSTRFSVDMTNNRVQVHDGYTFRVMDGGDANGIGFVSGATATSINAQGGVTSVVYENGLDVEVDGGTFIVSEQNSGNQATFLHNNGLFIDQTVAAFPTIFNIAGTERFRIGSDTDGYVGTRGGRVFRIYDSANTSFGDLSYNNSTYGSLRTTQTRSGYAGLNMSTGAHDMVLMSDGTNAGIYNDTDNAWLFYGVANGGVRLNYDGAQRFDTNASGILVTGDIGLTGVYKVGNSTARQLNTPSLRGTVNAGGTSDASGVGGYNGYSINNDVMFMDNGSLSGIYDEVNNLWRVRFDQSRSPSGTGVTSSAQVIDHGGTLRDIGFNILPLFNDDVSDTTEARHAGSVQLKEASTARTLTLSSSTDLDFPVNGMTTILNAFTSGNYTVNEGASTTLYFLDGSTRVDTAGGMTIGPGGYANVWRRSATVYIAWGAGVTP